MKNLFLQFRTFFVAALLLVIAGGSVTAQKFTYSDSWGEAGFNLVSSKSTAVEVVFSVPEFEISDFDVKGEVMQNVNVPGIFLPNNAGAPNLPGTGRYLAIPEGAVASVEIVGYRTEIIKNVNVIPAAAIPWDTDKTPTEYIKNMNIYGKDALYPASPVQLSNIQQLRGVDAVVLGITPFQYNPVKKELIVYRDLKVKVSFDGGSSFGDNRLRSMWWDDILDDVLLNYNSLPAVDYGSRVASNSKTVGCDYLIITPNGADFVTWANTLRDFRQLQGINTKVVTLAEIGGSTTTAIETYVNNAYNTWEPAPSAVLLLGDYGTNADNSVISPIYDSYCASDNIYSDVDGDHIPEIVFARMTAQNATHLQTMINKVINYESTPPTSEYFYDHPVTALGWQTERWFQICSEVIGGFWKNELGKTPVRVNAVYDGNPASDPWSTATNTSTVLNYFGPNGLAYIPASPSTLGGWTGGNAAQVNAAINAGAFMLQHRDHGFEEGWGEPDYTNANLSGVNNTDLTFIFSVNCLTGKYNWGSECFAEKLHRMQKGVVGILAASEVSYSFVNDAFVWGLYDNLWPDFMPAYGTPSTDNDWVYPAFGMAAGKAFLEQSSWPYNTDNKEVTYNLFHHHGCAFNTVYTEVPQNLTVVHDGALLSGLTSFDVTADAGAVIALTVGGEIVGLGIGNGSSPTSIAIESQLPGGDPLVITVTKQNYFRYSQTIQIIPPSGPYVVRHAFEVADPAPNGNANGILEFDESGFLSVTVKNVGIEDATNVVVTISTTDEFITITDNTENYGTVAANGGLITMPNGFALSVANNVEDEHVATILVSATNGTATWESNIALTLYAPVLGLDNVVIDDATGNGNGRLDPGENVTMSIDGLNIGGALAPETEISISTTSTNVVITNPSVVVGDIAVAGTQTADFNLEIDADAMIGEVAIFHFTITSGEYTYSVDVAKKIGLLMEDWETNTFNSFDWELSGNANWQIVNTNVYEGQYALQSGDINDEGSSTITLELEVIGDDEISFARKVSSEGNWDFLKFYIDGTVVQSWSGDLDWAEVTFPVTAGTHTFKWVYSKDGTVSNGSDCAWLDNIILPACVFGNVPPVIVSTPIEFVKVGFEYNYQIVVQDNNATDEIEITADVPAWLTFTDNGNKTATLVGEPLESEIGEHAIEITATDGVNAPVVQQFVIVVAQNNAPAFASTPVLTINDNEEYIYEVVANDEDGDDIEFSATSLPEWLSFEDNGDGTATVSGTLAKGVNDEFNITIAATDGAIVTEQSYVLTVIITSVDNLANGAVTIYPNPATNFISISNTVKIDMIQIIDIEGRVVITKSAVNNDNMNNIDVSSLAKGSYFVKVIANGKVDIQKIVVQ